MPELELVSHHLCPFAQRAAIVLHEKRAAFVRTDVDLGDRPDWFKVLSPLGKVPLLKVGETVLFESAVICDYLDETIAPRLHPADALRRAQHRGWIEFASAILNDIGGLYNAADEMSFHAKAGDLKRRFMRVEDVLDAGPYFAGARFSIVDAAFGPVFRYFDVFESFTDLEIVDALPKVRAWRKALAERESVRLAVDTGYPGRLRTFLETRRSYMAKLMAAPSLRAAP